jgi:hypothetical protein
MIGRKEVINMKSIKSLLSVVFLTGAMGLSAMSVAADGVISKDVLPEGDYCHMKFPAIREDTLAWKHPVLEDDSSGNIIDFYGPCDHDPLGEKEIQSQKHQQFRHRLPEE